MAFISLGLSSRHISFNVADDHMGSDHFPIQISLDKPLKRSTPLNEPRYRFDLINEKRRLRRQYNNTQDPNTKSTINKLQKEIRTKINQELTISWEKFCNFISLESDPKIHGVR